MMTSCCYIPKRYIMIVLAHFGMFMFYAIRVNLSVALVSMVNSTYAQVQPNMDPECGKTMSNATASSNNGQFNWDQSQQGIILSSFFYGYLIMQIPGGWLAMKYGGSRVLGYCALLTCLFTLLTPVAARLHIVCLIVVRVLEGLSQGSIFPAINQLVAQWVPQAEITSFFVIIFTGLNSGTVVALSTSGILADSTILDGWPLSFYIFGGLLGVWCFFWFLCVYDSPDQHPTISDVEKETIKNGIKGLSSCPENTEIPWKAMLTSLPVWAIIIGCFSDSWVWTMALTGLPAYFEQVLGFKLAEDGLLSALPYMCTFVMYLIVGFTSDYVRKHYLSTTKTRKLFASFVYIPTTACLIAVGYAGCDQITLSVALMVMSVVFLSANQGAVTVNQVDISPRYCGILCGLTNTSASIASCISPAMIGYFTNDNPSREQYRKVFMLAACVCLAGGTFCMIFMRGEVQPWNDYHDDHHDNKIINDASGCEDQGESRTHDENERLIEC